MILTWPLMGWGILGKALEGKRFLVLVYERYL
jgi:hypothetical protein